MNDTGCPIEPADKSLDYPRIAELAAALAYEANNLHHEAERKDFTKVRYRFGWVKTLFAAVEYEVKHLEGY